LKTIENTLVRLRVKSGMTQAQLADKLHTSKSTIGMWEQGLRKPGIVTLKKLSEIFEVTTDELLEDITTDNQKGAST